MNIIKLSFETTEGKYRLFATEDSVLEILNNPLFIDRVVDAKTGKTYIHRDEILKALQIEPPKPKEQ